MVHVALTDSKADKIFKPGKNLTNLRNDFEKVPIEMHWEKIRLAK